MIRVKVQEELANRKQMFVTVPDDFYSNVKAHVELVITGEQIDIPKRLETLTNLYTTLSQKQDPRADKVLSMILAISGENIDALAGASQPQAAQMPALAQAQQGMAMPTPQGQPQSQPMNI